MNKIIGRSNEQALLQSIYDLKKAEFLAVYGKKNANYFKL
jgi:hypothetical protein